MTDSANRATSRYEHHFRTALMAGTMLLGGLFAKGQTVPNAMDRGRFNLTIPLASYNMSPENLSRTHGLNVGNGFSIGYNFFSGRKTDLAIGIAKDNKDNLISYLEINQLLDNRNEWSVGFKKGYNNFTKADDANALVRKRSVIALGLRRNFIESKSMTIGVNLVGGTSPTSGQWTFATGLVFNPK